MVTSLSKLRFWKSGAKQKGSDNSLGQEEVRGTLGSSGPSGWKSLPPPPERHL